MAEKTVGHMTLSQRIAKLGPQNQSRVVKVVEWLEEAERDARNYSNLIYQHGQLLKKVKDGRDYKDSDG